MSSTLDILFAHQARTNGIVVRVAVSFLPDQSEPARGRWFWSYHVRIENESADEVQLVARRWIITDGRGARHRVEGEGVIGAQPILPPGGSYDYVSGCPLDTPSGTMEGAYRMLGADGSRFEAKIPRFALIGPAVAG